MATEKKPCPKCGEGNYPSDRNCMSCGALLSPLKAPPPPPPVAPPPPRAFTPVAPAADSGFGALIPIKNSAALGSYYIGIFSLLPLIGLPMGVIALVLGIKGLKFAKANPGVHGTVHAWVGIVCGGFWALAYALVTVVILIGVATPR